MNSETGDATEVTRPATSAAPVEGEGRGKLLGIQAARGAAALLVAFYHAGRMLRSHVGGSLHGGIFNFGYSGVTFFFVLSGFIIYYVHQKDIGERRRAPSYLWKRLTRVYPIYWVVMVYVIVKTSFTREAAQKLQFDYVAKSLLLIPLDMERLPLLGVAWTLSYEVFFYLVFVVWILDRRVGGLVMGAWLMLIVYNLFSPYRSLPMGFIASSFHLLFFAGIATAALVKSGRVRYPVFWMWAGIGGFLAVGAADDLGLVPAYTWSTQNLYTVFAAMSILGLATSELRGQIRVGPAAAFAGAVSYALYLVHVEVFVAVARVLGRLGLNRAIPPWCVLLLAVGAAVLVACFVHIFAERPIAAALNRRNARRLS